MVITFEKRPYEYQRQYKSWSYNNKEITHSNTNKRTSQRLNKTTIRGWFNDAISEYCEGMIGETLLRKCIPSKVKKKLIITEWYVVVKCVYMNL